LGDDLLRLLLNNHVLLLLLHVLGLRLQHFALHERLLLF
jgi:hypothetical protein